MTDSGLEFWIALVALAVITYLTRALPFMMSSRAKWLARFSRDDSVFAALGPSLLAGIAAAVVVPDLLGADLLGADLLGADLSGVEFAPYLGGLAVTAVAVKWTGNTGVAIILGVAAYGGLGIVM